jgi:thiamine-phosphate diphosphorylase
MPLPRPRNLICLVTDRRRLPAAEGGSPLDRLVELVAAAGRAGIDLVQIRERDLDGADLARLTRRCVTAVGDRGTKILVNDRADVALAAGAHGVHLRSDSVGAAELRRLLPSGAVVGRSVHTIDEAVAASHEGGIDYLIFGTLFATPSKDASHAIASMAELSAACAAARVPVLGIGGLTLERADEAVRAGAAGVAAIGLFLPPSGSDVERHLQLQVAGLRRVFDTSGVVS